MKILSTIKYVFAEAIPAFSVSWVFMIIASAGEGLQHCVELYLGMYQSRAMFVEHQSDLLRLGFGGFKVLCMLIGCYLVAKRLSEIYGPSPRFGSFAKDMIRKLWDPRMGITGLCVGLALSVPVIFIHYQLGTLAMGNQFAGAILILDSVVVGFIAFVMGLSFWAGDKAEHDSDSEGWVRAG